MTTTKNPPNMAILFLKILNADRCSSELLIRSFLVGLEVWALVVLHMVNYLP